MNIFYSAKIGRFLPKAGIMVTALALVAGCQNYTLVDGSRVTVKDSCSVEPQVKWSKASRSTFGNPTRTEVWTADGESLDMVAIFCGVRDGEAIFTARATAADGTTKEQQEEPFKFQSAMTANEVMDLFESGLGKVTQSSIVRAHDLRPEKVSGFDGFRFEISFVQKDDVDREGTVIATIANDKLYLFFFEGTRLYHYSKYLPTVEAMFRSVQIPKT